MLENLHNRNIILGSQSPRRKELLQGLDITFEVRAIPDHNEDYEPQMPVEKVPEYLAQKKASFYKSELKPNDILITADTVVILDQQILGKPHDRDEAKTMLQHLSNHKHKVVTGVCITYDNQQETFCATSSVIFGNMETEEIEYYLDHYKPYDKAGSYGIQEWIGYIAIKHIEGSFFNVMGLPVYPLYQKLKAIPKL